MSEYTARVDAFLQERNITFTVELIGMDCPPFCPDRVKGIDTKFPRKTHIHGKHYQVTFQRVVTVPKGLQGNSEPYQKNDVRKPPLVQDFWNSYADEEFNALGCAKYRAGTGSMYGIGKRANGTWGSMGKRKVTAYDVLSYVEKNDVGTFEDFCSDFGYDSDSRRAESTYHAIYHAVQEESRKVRAFFTKEEIETLQEIAQ